MNLIKWKDKKNTTFAFASYFCQKPDLAKEDLENEKEFKAHDRGGKIYFVFDVSLSQFIGDGVNYNKMPLFINIFWKPSNLLFSNYILYAFENKCLDYKQHSENCDWLWDIFLKLYYKHLSCTAQTIKTIDRKQKDTPMRLFLPDKESSLCSFSARIKNAAIST